MARLGKRRRRLISIGRIGGKAPKGLRSAAVDDSLELEDQAFSNPECETAPNSLESMAAEDNISPSEPREYLESPKYVEELEASLYESEEDTDEEWELDDDDSDALSGSEEVLYPSFIFMLLLMTTI